MATNLRPAAELLTQDRPFAHLLAQPGVTEQIELRSQFGFLAFHGGALEEITDEIALEAAQRSGASVYVVSQPDHQQWHLPSHMVDPADSALLAAFLGHVEVAVAVHGYGRVDYWRTVLVGGRHRPLAEHVAVHLIPRCLHYEVVADLDRIPRELRGLHAHNPINRVRGGGAQVELPPRIRGLSRLFPHNGPGRMPHLEGLIDGLAAAARAWPERAARLADHDAAPLAGRIPA
jgi:phage replication-related protein YjqB (UPF0714/DUF867 family)